MSEVFGRAKFFAIYDDEAKEFKFHENPGSTQARGAGMTAGQFAIDNDVKVAILPQIGPNADTVLSQAGIDVRQVSDKDKTVKQLIDSL